jgi:peptide/nickel transport system substrate-binding protein
MKRGWRRCGAAWLGLAMAVAPSAAALAQKSGGILRVTHRDSPASMSIHEEGTFSVVIPMMGVFNNLVMYDQHVPQNSLGSIVPDLATGWSWDEDGTALTFTLREGVRWHDGKPFTAADVRCTFDLLANRGPEKLRLNFRAAWYLNLAEVTTDGDYRATLHLKRRQPAFLALLASGYSPIYPCHVAPRDMRQHPVGTGPFKFVEYKPNQSIRVARNPDYWKADRPYLDGVEYTIIPNRSTAILGFVAGKFDMTFPYEVTVPLARQINEQAPQAICEVAPIAGRINLLINHTAPPFNDLTMRRAMALSLDRQAFIDILTEGKGDVGGVLLPPPEGIWGMPQDLLRTLPGYGPDVAARRAQARDMMRQLGYGPDKRMKVTVSTRNVSLYRDPATILIDQLKEIWIDGELETIETANWVPKLIRHDYTVAQSASGSAVDDPDPQLIENYMCGTPRDVTGYCSPELDRMIVRQSMESDPALRKEIAWQIERKLIEDAVRPIIYYQRAATCWQPQVKGLTLMTNSPFNGWRMEDIWLDR